MLSSGGSLVRIRLGNPLPTHVHRAVDAMKRYHQAQANGVTGTELERLPHELMRRRTACTG
ncbi:hypothetical protein D8767_14445 [Pseudomonas sp. LTGT-11-2Z]|nr:hypothetical protein D8767_14445 [Pseudomonas sp. LTGT-11-2Z]